MSVATSGYFSKVGSIDLDTHSLHLISTNDYRICETENQTPPYDKGHGTKIFCVACICGGAMLAIGSLIFGIYLLITHPSAGVEVQVPSFGWYLINWPLNILHGLFMFGMTHARDVSLCWVLFSEDRLEYNTNVSPFASSRHIGPYRWYVNAIFYFFSWISYGCVPMMIWDFSINKPGPDIIGMTQRRLMRITLCGIPSIIFGVALLLAVTINVWTLVSTTSFIATWSSNPLNTTLAAIHNTNMARIPGRSMRSSHEHQDMSNAAIYPRVKQSSLIQDKSIAYLLIAPWGLAAAVIAAAVSTGMLGPLAKGTSDDTQLRFSWRGVDVPGTTLTIDMRKSQDEALQTRLFLENIRILLVMAMKQVLVAVPMKHVAVIFSLWRDESIWRRAYDNNYRDASAAPRARLLENPLLAVTSSLASVMLCVTGGALQWGISQCLVCIGPVTEETMPFPILAIHYPRLVVYVAIPCVTAVLVTWTATRSHKGPQPVSFGHLQTLANLVDDWETDEKGRFWWGDKTSASSSEGGYRWAGTSSRRELLSPIRISEEYR